MLFCKPDPKANQNPVEADLIESAQKDLDGLVITLEFLDMNTIKLLTIQNDPLLISNPIYLFDKKIQKTVPSLTEDPDPGGDERQANLNKRSSAIPMSCPFQ